MAMSGGKIFVLFCVVIVLFATLTGLSDHLTYDGVKVAAEHIQTSSNSLIADVSFIKCLVSVVKEFDVSCAQTVYAKGPTHSRYWTEIGWANLDSDGNISGSVVLAEGELMFSDYTPYLKILEWFEHDELSSNWFTKGIDTIIILFKFVVGVIYGLVSIAFSFFEYLWCIIESFFYLVGITQTL